MSSPKSLELTDKEASALRLIESLLKVRYKYKLTPSEAGWIINACGLAEAAKSLLEKETNATKHPTARRKKVPKRD